jgi:hypothetical protein
VDRQSSTFFLTGCAIIAVLFVIQGCKEGTTSINPSPTDVYTISSVNKYITDTDIKAGVVKSRGLMNDVKISMSYTRRPGRLLHLSS